MAIVITVKNVSNGSTLRMEVENSDKISEIIDSAAEYWKKGSQAFVLKKGKSLLLPSQTVGECGMVSDDVIELMPDPEGGSE